MALDQGITDSVTLANTKIFGDTMASLQALAIQNAIHTNNIANQGLVKHQHAIDQLTLAVIAKAVNKISDAQVENAVAVEKEASAGLPEAVSSLLGALASGQQTVKAAQSTPPETGLPTSGTKAA